MSTEETRQLLDAIYFLASCVWRGLLGVSLILIAHGLLTRRQ